MNGTLTSATGAVTSINQTVPGLGNLLGSLLCAVANLFNGSGIGGVLSSIVARLNTLLGML